MKVVAFEMVEGKPQVRAYAKQSLPEGAVRGGLIISEEGVLESCRQALNEAVSSLEIRPKNVYVSLSGEMVQCLSTAARLTRPNPEDPISEKELNNTRRQIEEAANIEASKEFAVLSGSDYELKLLHSDIFSAKVDNFNAVNLVGLKGEILELAITTAFVQVISINPYYSLIKKLGLNLLGFKSALYSLSSVLKKNQGGVLNTILLDIGGETTDIAVIFGGGIAGNRTLGLAGRFFSQIIAERLGVNINEAEIKKISYGNGRLEPSSQELILVALTDMLPVFLSGIEVSLLDIEGIKLLPNEILVSGGGSLLPEARDFLSQKNWTHDLPIKGELKVTILTAKDLGLQLGEIPGTEFLTAMAVGLL